MNERITVKTVSQYVTTDGEVFDHPNLAEEHQEKIDYACKALDERFERIPRKDVDVDENLELLQMLTDDLLFDYKRADSAWFFIRTPEEAEIICQRYGTLMNTKHYAGHYFPGDDPLDHPAYALNGWNLVIAIKQECHSGQILAFSKYWLEKEVREYIEGADNFRSILALMPKTE